MRVAVRVDGGTRIGMGHLIRQRTLAATLVDRGHEVTVVSATPERARDIFEPLVTVESTERGPTATVGALERTDHDVTVLDLPVESADPDADLLDLSLQRALDALETALAVVTDGVEQTVACDLVVNGHVYADRDGYSYRGTEPTWCLGTDYLLMDRAMRNVAADLDSDFDPSSTPERALVTMGGSDAADATPTVMGAFDGLDVWTDVVVGPGFSEANVAAIEAAAGSIESRFEVVTDPPDFATRLARADLAVSALGLTAYELLAVGTPFVGVTIAPDQRLKADALAARDAALVLDGDWAGTDVRAAVETLVSNPDRRRELARRGRSLVDTDGVERVADALEALA